MKDIKQNGFTMVELIITIAVLSFGIVSGYTAFSSIANIADSLSYRLTAAFLSQEGLEIIKNQRDKNFISAALWNAGLLSCSDGCQADYKTGTIEEEAANQLQAYDEDAYLKINTDGFYSYDAGTDTRFKRKITITQESASILKVNSEVSWDYNNRSFTKETIEYLYNWY